MTSDFKLVYEALLAEQKLPWTSAELTAFARFIERDRCLSESERSALLGDVKRRRELGCDDHPLGRERVQPH